VNPPDISAVYALTHRVRWRIFAFLFGFAFIAYFQQKGLTVAAERMMPELGISQVQVGWLEWAFVLGYAAFQFPGGVIGQRLGARVTFTLIGVIAFLATVFTPLAPRLLQGGVVSPREVGNHPRRADHGHAICRCRNSADRRIPDEFGRLAAGTFLACIAGGARDRIVGMVWTQHTQGASIGYGR
jgi:MFS family permease